MDFWNELIGSVVSNGIFAMLFVFLLFYQLKDSQKREQAYRNTINELSTHLIIIEQVREELADLKDMISREER
ncbi:MAG: bacteriocin [Clostridia bacterium]|nr:bacteriocin [Clostridia bacterium]MBQ8792514.1 bacteriocin [Clostridia bacterium]